jgi:hypothetical protein
MMKPANRRERKPGMAAASKMAAAGQSAKISAAWLSMKSYQQWHQWRRIGNINGGGSMAAGEENGENRAGGGSEIWRQPKIWPMTRRGGIEAWLAASASEYRRRRKRSWRPWRKKWPKAAESLAAAKYRLAQAA